MITILISLGIGLCIGLFFWQIWTFFRDVPFDDRQFMDRPATGFRLTMPFINLVVHYFGDYMSPASVQAADLKLKQGGVEFSVNAKQFLASKFVAVIVVLLFGVIADSALERNIVLFAIAAAVGAFFYPDLWLKEATKVRQNNILKTLPFYLDIVTLSVEAGSNLTGGMTQAVQKSPESPLRREFSRVLRDIRAGRTRAQALRDLSDRSGNQAVQNVVSGLIQAERTGSSLGPLLRAQSEQLRTDRFQRAEKLAMEAPVKLLAPLMMFIFPNTFLVLGFLLLSKSIQTGVIKWAPIVWAFNFPG